MVQGQRYKYNAAAIRRICLRELGKEGVVLFQITLAMNVGQYLASWDFDFFVTSVAFSLCLMLVIAGFYAGWCVLHLRSVFFRFDREELIYDFEQDRREILATDVVSFLSTPRLIHILSKRKNCTVTIHSELEGYEELRSALTAWSPVAPVEWTSQPSQSIFRACLTLVALIGIYALSYKLPHDWRGIAVMIGLLALLLGLYWYRSRRKSPTSAPPLPSYLVP